MIDNAIPGIVGIALGLAGCAFLVAGAFAKRDTADQYARSAERMFVAALLYLAATILTTTASIPVLGVVYGLCLAWAIMGGLVDSHTAVKVRATEQQQQQEETRRP